MFQFRSLAVRQAHENPKQSVKCIVREQQNNSIAACIQLAERYGKSGLRHAGCHVGVLLTTTPASECHGRFHWCHLPLVCFPSWLPQSVVDPTSTLQRLSGRHPQFQAAWKLRQISDTYKYYHMVCALTPQTRNKLGWRSRHASTSRVERQDP